MYKYSPIRSIQIKNFRNIGDVTLDFTESPIVTLVGENEAGKTSVIKAFSTCGLNANPRDQKGFIRDNTKMFGVMITLEDGHKILRVKELTGVNSYQIIDKDNNVVWSTGKITDGLPIEVQNLMGLIAEPETNEFLQIRTYEDKLLFAVTPYSTNYKVMYNALKVEQLTKAIKIGSTNANTLKNEINCNDIKIQTLQNQISSITIYDVESLTTVKNRLLEQINTLNKLRKAKQLCNRVAQIRDELGALALINMFKLENIDELYASKLYTANKLLAKISNMGKLSNILNQSSSIEEINVDKLNKIANLLNKVKILDEKINDAGALIHVSEISEISETTAMQLNKVHSLINGLDTLQNQERVLKEITEQPEVTANALSRLDKLQKIYNDNIEIEQKETEIKNINTYILQVQNYMKQCGVAVETCPNCGNDVIIDLDKLK